MIPLVLIVENLLFPFAALGVLLKFALSPRRGVLRELGGELSQRFGKLSPDALRNLAKGPTLWVHAASAGEVSAAAGLVAELRRRKPGWSVLMTTTTSSGRRKAESLPCVDAAALAPLDCAPAMARFLDSARPRALLLVETELWPHMIELSRRRGLRLGLVNGRLSPEAFSLYRRLAFLAGPFLRRVERIAAQSEADAGRFLELGADPESVRATGNLKFDSLRPSPEIPRAVERLKALGWSEDPILVAGSTHPGEEELVAAAFSHARASCPNLRLVLAPRHLERSSDAGAVLADCAIGYRRWTAGPSPAAAEDTKPQALLLDTMGMLSAFYARAFVSFVGGTLVEIGGHNLLEPAIAGSPVVFGPHTSHTAESAALLESAGCGFRVEDSADLARVLRELLADRERTAALGRLARRTAEGLQGATERTLAHLAEILDLPPLVAVNNKK